MKVLIIGGTGFIGPLVARHLNESGCKVILFHRGKTTADLPSGVTHIFGDRHTIASCATELLRFSPDIVLDMIPVTELDAQVVVNMFEGIAGRIVAISSQDVYLAYGVMIGIEKKEIQNIPLTENSSLRQKIYPYRGDNFRTDSDPLKWMDYYDKILVEKTVMGNPKLPGTVMRLPMVYGPGDKQHRLYPYIKRIDDGRPAIILDEGLAAWRWTRGYVENIAAGIVLAVMNDRASNRIYNLGERDAMTMAEWIDNIAHVAGWHGRIVVLPKRDLPGSLIADFNTAQHLVTDSCRIREELKYNERFSLRDGLSKTIDWERSNPPGSFGADAFDYQIEDEVLKTLNL